MDFNDEQVREFVARFSERLADVRSYLGMFIDAVNENYPRVDAWLGQYQKNVDDWLQEAARKNNWQKVADDITDVIRNSEANTDLPAEVAERQRLVNEIADYFGMPMESDTAKTLLNMPDEDFRGMYEHFLEVKAVHNATVALTVNKINKDSGDDDDNHGPVPVG